MTPYNDLKKQERDDFIDYLQQQLIPDLTESGFLETAKDFERAIALIRDLEPSLNPLKITARGPGTRQQNVKGCEVIVNGSIVKVRQRARRATDTAYTSSIFNTLDSDIGIKT